MEIRVLARRGMGVRPELGVGVGAALAAATGIAAGAEPRGVRVAERDVLSGGRGGRDGERQQRDEG